MQFKVLVSVLVGLTGLVQSVAINNIKVAKTLTTAGKTVANGYYYIQNVKTRQYLHAAKRGQKYDIYPSKQKSRIYLKKNTAGQKWLRMSVDDKCFSSQWDEKVEGGADHASVMYRCVVAPNVKAPLEKPKQWQLFVPASFGKRSLDDDEEREWDASDFEGTDEDEDEDNSSEEDWQVSKEDEEDVEIDELFEGKRLTKRGTSVGKFYIIATDHIKDMHTRALTGKKKKTFGGAISTVLSKWKKGDKSQIWEVIKA